MSILFILLYKLCLILYLLTLLWLVDFFNNSARKNFIAMKLFDFLQLLIVQLLKKFHRNILKNEGVGDNFLGLTLEKSQILTIIAKKGAEMEYFATFFCNVELFDAFYHKYHVWMENVLQI